MEITSKNCKTAERIIQVLAEEGCTVRQSAEILSYVNRTIHETSAVHFHPSMITEKWSDRKKG